MNILILGIVLALVLAKGYATIEGNLQFTADLYREMVKIESENFVISPLSAETVLALAQVGARGATAQQLSDVLHLPDDREAIRRIFQQATENLQSKSQYKLESANKIYVSNDVDITEEYEDTAISVFDAELQNIDFNERKVAVDEINRWVARKTGRKIKNVLKPSDLGGEPSLVLVNALCFEGTWVNVFHKSQTKEMPFYLDRENFVPVHMMYLREDFDYYESPNLNAKYLKMPYRGGDVSITFVLPNDREGLDNLEFHFSEVFDEPQYKREQVYVSIPKFRTETTTQLDPILKVLGVLDAFQNSADFSGISQDELKITKVVQKTFIDITQSGAAAAADSDDVVGKNRPHPPKEYVANHPFIYFLTCPQGVLFVGRFVISK